MLVICTSKGLMERTGFQGMLNSLILVTHISWECTCLFAGSATGKMQKYPERSL